jgi:hypothetical protein
MRAITLIIALSVLMFASNVSQAALVFFDTADPEVLPGETISVTIFSTVDTDSIRMDRISDADAGIASNLYLNPNYDLPLNEGVVVNENGVLIEDVNTGITLAFPAVSGVLYSFDYLVPMAQPGHIITIFADPSNDSVNEVWYDIGSGLESITPEALSLTVVPEPATIYLLLIGGLVALRKLQQGQ